MLLYKYRSLQDIEFTFDIILNQKLYCAEYDKLNDPFEGLFHTIFSPQLATTLPMPFVSKEVKECKTIEDLPFDLEKSKICSLSGSLNDIRLWSHYADGHKGIAIEIDFEKNIDDIYKVNYWEELPVFGNTILASPNPIDVLSIKTVHWSYEDEYRIIQKDNNYPITGRIKSIYTGHRISDFHLSLLEKITPKGIQLKPTKINTSRIIVEPK